MRNSILNITCITVLQFTEWLRLNRTSVDHLVHSGCLSRDSSNRLLRAASSHVLSKTKDGDSTSSLCNLVHCLIILSVKKKKKCFLCSDRVLCVSVYAYCPSLDTAEKSLVSSSLFPSRQIFTHIDIISLSLFFSRLESPISLRLSLSGEAERDASILYSF